MPCGTLIIHRFTGYFLDAVWQVVVPQFDPATFVRQKFAIPSGYDETEVYRTNFYYYEHETIEAREVEITDKTGQGYRVRITGEMLDPNFYDGSKPLTRIELEADFTLTRSETALKPVG